MSFANTESIPTKEKGRKEIKKKNKKRKRNEKSPRKIISRCRSKGTMPARNDRQRENDWDAARRKTRLGTNEAWKRWLKTASSRRTPPGTSNDSRLQAVISDYASPSTDFHPFHHFLSTMAPREAINIGNWVDFRWASKCRPADANIRTVSSLKISTVQLSPFFVERFILH